MDNLTHTLQAIAPVASSLTQKTSLVGLDGFVDKIMAVVGRRQGRGQDFTPMETITEFGQRVLAAAGESANMELYPQVEKIGGNGPIMANALLAAGVKTTYAGMLGIPLHPVFTEFAAKTRAVSLGQPGITNALEFTDGKLLLGEMADFDNLNYDRIVSTMGEGPFLDLLSRSDLISLVNWTMIPGMTEIFEDLLTRALPTLPPKDGGRVFFFDLADPAKRSSTDLLAGLHAIRRFQAHGRVLLGLNLAEARQVAKVLEVFVDGDSPEVLKDLARRIRDKLEITAVVVHPRAGAACATRDHTVHVEGPFCAAPKISTGAGDHFNAGFCVGYLLGLDPIACLTVAVATSGQYVRTAKSPSLSDTQSFLARWKEGRL
jgi:sugar/nucleoside kinase (ribokinase family)